MSKKLLINPRSGSYIFGNVPQIKSKNDIIPTGDIFLFQGKHVGPNRGFGAIHIWREHAKEMAQIGLTSFDEVPNFVSNIVQIGTPLYFGDRYSRKIRLMAVRHVSGTAILECIQRNDGTIWSIVTAFSGRNTNGTRVGSVR